MIAFLAFLLVMGVLIGTYAFGVAVGYGMRKWEVSMTKAMHRRLGLDDEWLAREFDSHEEEL